MIGMSIQKEQISRGYDKIAEEIALSDAFYARAVSLHRNYHGKILDIGCGQGLLIKKIRACTPDVKMHGIDLSQKLCEISKRNNPDAYILNGDAESLPYDDDSFDFVFMTEALEHMLDYDRALSEAHRVLKPGGIFIVTVPNRDWLRYDFYDKLRNKKLQPVDDHYFRFDEIRSLLKNNHFHIVKCKGSDNLYYYAPYHTYEQALAVFIPFLHRKMKRLMFKCTKNA